MTDNTTDTEARSIGTLKRLFNVSLSRRQQLRILSALVVVGLFLMMTVGGAAAQTTTTTSTTSSSSTINICSSQNALIPIANAIIQISLFGGLAGFVVTYFSTTAVETLPVGQDTKERVRDHRSSAMKSTLKIIAIGPIGWLVITFADLPWASCINLNPFF